MLKDTISLEFPSNFGILSLIRIEIYNLIEIDIKFSHFDIFSFNFVVNSF